MREVNYNPSLPVNMVEQVKKLSRNTCTWDLAGYVAWQELAEFDDPGLRTLLSVVLGIR